MNKTHQGLLESLEGTGVQHFLLDLGGVRAPRHQEQLLLLGALSCALHVQNINEGLDRESIAK